MVLLAVSALLSVFNRTLTLDGALTHTFLLSFESIGALIVARRPENRIGWVFCGGALLWVAGLSAQEYARYQERYRRGCGQPGSRRG
jgi:hypothetical protein